MKKIEEKYGLKPSPSEHEIKYIEHSDHESNKEGSEENLGHGV